MTSNRVVAVDQGTTGTKAFTLDESGAFKPVASFNHRTILPRPGWVEHNAEELFSHVHQSLALAGKIEAAGIDNQGETIVAFDSSTGNPIYNAIVWQDDRTKDVTAKLKAEGAEAETLRRAGLPLDPYFSATKFKWILDHVEEAKSLGRANRLRLGTSDAYFNYRLTGAFVTDVTTASRTSLMNLDTMAWDPELCRLFGVPAECLPAIRPTAGLFGEMSIDGRTIPLTASLVDQQAALFGHGCQNRGDAKITFGTGAFALAVAGKERIDGSRFGIVSTIAWKVGENPISFALDGGVYNAGSAVNWARGLGLFSDYAEIGQFASPSAIERGLAFVPALSGLACPHWDRTAAGLWIGMGLETSRLDMMQSLLEGIALRSAEVFTALSQLLPVGNSVSIDGGLTGNGYFCRFLANALNRTIVVPQVSELTALGTARMAMLGAGAVDLPALPPPKVRIIPDPRASQEMQAIFARAVERAKNWKQD